MKMSNSVLDISDNLAQWDDIETSCLSSSWLNSQSKQDVKDVLFVQLKAALCHA